MPNYLGKLRSFLIIYYRVYAKELIAKVYAKDVKELIIYYYYYLTLGASPSPSPTRQRTGQAPRGREP